MARKPKNNQTPPKPGWEVLPQPKSYTPTPRPATSWAASVARAAQDRRTTNADRYPTSIPQGAGPTAPKAPVKPFPSDLLFGPNYAYAQQVAAGLEDATIDPYGGMTAAELLAAYNANNRTTSGSGGGGGGGGRSGPSAADLSAAYNAYLGSSQGMTDQQLSAYDMAQKRMGGVFDDRTAEAERRRAEGEARRQAILAQLQGDTGLARTSVQGAYAGGDQRLAALGAEYQGLADSRVAPMNQTLQAFGAAPLGAAGTSALESIMAQRAALQGQAGTSDALYANRANVQNALGSDAAMVDQGQFQALINAIAQARMEQQAKAEMDRLGIIQRGQQSQADLRFQAAKEGVQL